MTPPSESQASTARAAAPSPTHDQLIQDAETAATQAAEFAGTPTAAAYFNGRHDAFMQAAGLVP